MGSLPAGGCPPFRGEGRACTSSAIASASAGAGADAGAGAPEALPAVAAPLHPGFIQAGGGAPSGRC